MTGTLGLFFVLTLLMAAARRLASQPSARRSRYKIQWADMTTKGTTREANVGKTQVSLPTVLVTGGAGFIGSYATAELMRPGHALRMVGQFSTGSRGNLAAVGGDLKLVEAAIRSYERTHAAMSAVAHIVVGDLAVTERVADGASWVSVIPRLSDDMSEYVAGQSLGQPADRDE